MKRRAIPSTLWSLVDEPHRCTRHDCAEPAVVVTYGLAYHGLTKHRRGKWICATHMRVHRLFVWHGRVWVAVRPTEPLADLAFVPPIMQRRSTP